MRWNTLAARSSLVAAAALSLASACNRKGAEKPAPSEAKSNESSLPTGSSQEYDAFAKALRGGPDAESRKSFDARALQATLEEWDKRFDEGKLSDVSVKLHVALLAPLSTMRALTYRMRPLFSREERNAFGLFEEAPTRGVHNAALIGVMQAASFQRILLPAKNFEALFDYLTVPPADMEQYHGTAEWQSKWLCKDFKAATEKALARVTALPVTDSDPVRIDAAAILLEGAFQGGGIRDRYVTVGEAEKAALLSGFQQTLHNVEVGCAYSLEDSAYVAESMLSLLAVDGFLDRSRLDGFPASMRQNVVLGRVGRFKDKVTNPGTLLPDGKQRMAKALESLKKSVYYAGEAVRLSRARGPSTNMFPVLDWARLAPGDRVGGLVLEANKALVGVDGWGPGLRPDAVDIEASKANAANVREYRSIVQPDRAVKVSLERFYLDPVRDLRTLLPVEFEQGPRTFPVPGTGTGGVPKKEYHNYRLGMAKAWSPSPWQALFPSATSSESVAEHLRVFSESTGGFVLGGPLAAFVF